MLPPDKQRLEHILDYCCEIEKTIARYGKVFFVSVRNSWTRKNKLKTPLLFSERGRLLVL